MIIIKIWTDSKWGHYSDIELIRVSKIPQKFPVMKSLMLSIFLLVGIQWISSTNDQSCKHRVLQDTFIRCCRLDKYFTTQSIDECVSKCNDYNARKQAQDQKCSRVNWYTINKECSLLYVEPSDVNNPQLKSNHPDFIAAELDCANGSAPAPAPRPTPAPASTPTPAPPPSRPSKGVGCGKPASQYQPVLPKARIIGGNTAKAHTWPFQVSVRGSDGTWHFCGGSLLRVHEDKEESDIVLTAAHCVPIDNGQVGDFSYMSVVAGTQTQYVATPGQEKREIVDIQYHKDYANLINDIAILKLNKPIKFSDKIRPVCLANEGEGAPVGRTCVATGWGRNESQTQNSQDELKQAISPVHSLELCQANWYWQKQAWTYAFLCAGPLDGSSAVCNGDSGGPLVCKNDDGSWTQYGIASFVAGGGGCTKANMPPVFARVSSYAGWIREKINKMSALVG